MKRFRVIEVEGDRVRIEDTHMSKDKYGKFPETDYYFPDPPFIVGDIVDLVMRLRERPEPTT